MKVKRLPEILYVRQTDNNYLLADESLHVVMDDADGGSATMVGVYELLETRTFAKKIVDVTVGRSRKK